jgi:3'(2'), 5'-bisphosphate nucleotidase
MRDLVELAINAARLAGAQILAHYQKTRGVTWEQDGSPLTPADQAAHSMIIEHLANKRDYYSI